MPFTVDKGAGRYTIKHKLCANAPAGTNWTQPRAVPWTGVPKMHLPSSRRVKIIDVVA